MILMYDSFILKPRATLKWPYLLYFTSKDTYFGSKVSGLCKGKRKELHNTTRAQILVFPFTFTYLYLECPWACSIFSPLCCSLLLLPRWKIHVRVVKALQHCFEIPLSISAYASQSPLLLSPSQTIVPN